jgi:IS5 family transposase
VLALPDELAAADQLLDDPAFIQPFRTHVGPVVSRPWIPIETYLPMMFVNFRYRLGYESCNFFRELRVE